MGLKSHILHEDNHLLIINKYSGWLSQGDQTRDKSVLDMFKNYIKHRDNKPGEVFLGLPHRLDRPVSGILILCKTGKSLQRMTQMFKERSIKKIYHALVQDKIYSEPKKLVSYIKKDTRKNKAIISDKPFKMAKEAILSYEVIAIVDNFSLLEVQLQTGRPHQIRAQLSQHKMPIYGDSKYSSKRPLKDKSIALHSRHVEFVHPVSKESIKVTVPYPEKQWWGLFQ